MTIRLGYFARLLIYVVPSPLQLNLALQSSGSCSQYIDPLPPMNATMSELRMLTTSRPIKPLPVKIRSRDRPWVTRTCRRANTGSGRVRYRRRLRRFAPPRTAIPDKPR